ncbi:hypothetical protein FJY94_05120 [Candidatus Kaiserbacteria bacterium]|nr:hypothetical protein [Candidatus Kaiserbacteria bacterium]
MYVDDFDVTDVTAAEDVVIPPQRKFADLQILFQYEQYEWDLFDPPYAVLRLTQGYFCIIDADGAREQRALKEKWHAVVQRDENGRVIKVYAARTRKGSRGGKIYLHRYLAGARPSEIADHFNGMTLDNRRSVNLRITNIAGNRANSESARRRFRHPGLPRGVEPRKGNKFQAQIKVNGVTYHSKRLWDTPRRAHVWYRRVHKIFHGIRCVSQSHLKDDFPVFPPRKGGDDDIPF